MKNILNGNSDADGFGVLAQEYHKAKFKVWGNCEMCQTKIVKATKSVEGVKKHIGICNSSNEC